MTVKLVLEVPCGTVTLAGATNAVLELEMPIDRLPAGFESATTQLLAAPTAILVGVHVRDDRLGVDHSSTVAFCEEAPRVALTTACVFKRIVTAIAVTLPVALPAEIVTVGGIKKRAELEFSETVVFADTACDSVIKQVVLAPDNTPVALQVTAETSTGARRPMVVVWELVPREAVRVAL
jgi:hypothetical protein